GGRLPVELGGCFAASGREDEAAGEGDQRHSGHCIDSAKRLLSSRFRYAHRIPGEGPELAPRAGWPAGGATREGHRAPGPDGRHAMNWLIWLAVVLVVLWILAEALGWVLGVAVHLLWIAALVLFVIWLFRKLRAEP